MRGDLGVVIESRHVPSRRFVLPVLARLYVNTKSATKWNRTYRKKTDLLVEMLELVDSYVRQGDAFGRVCVSKFSKNTSNDFCDPRLSAGHQESSRSTPPPLRTRRMKLRKSSSVGS